MVQRLIVVWLLLCASLGSNAQARKEIARNLMVKADKIMEDPAAIHDARLGYVNAAEIDPANLKANFMAGLTHLRTVKKSRASKYLLRVYDLNPDFRIDLTYLIGLSYQYGLEFDKAVDFYNLYIEKIQDNPGLRNEFWIPEKTVKRRIFECFNAIEYVANPTKHQITNLGPSVNSEFDDYAPVASSDETLLIFTSRRVKENTNTDFARDRLPYEDIYFSRKNGDSIWSQSANIGKEINTLYHDSNIALSRDGQQLFLYKDLNLGDIYVSTRLSDDFWTEPQALKGSVNSPYSEKSISMSADGNYIFFSSNRPGGRGGTDLYMAVRNKKGKWKDVRNLGGNINTEFDEEGPFLDYDGKTLFFSSKGHNGMGGFDIFKSEYDSATGLWGPPISLGYPINTADNDIYYITTNDGEHAYFASERDDGMGFADIYFAIEIEDIDAPLDSSDMVTTTFEEPYNFLVTVEDEKTGELVDADVKLQDQQNKAELIPERLDTGRYSFQILNPETQGYTLTVEKEGYMYQIQEVALPPTAEERAEFTAPKINLQKLDVGMSAVLHNIYFDFDKATLKIDSYFELNKLEKLLTENPQLHGEIIGHTDNVGTERYNRELSRKRAQSVVDFLANKGIERSRVMAVGMGASQPIASNDDEEEGRELNRRVEFKIVGLQ